MGARHERIDFVRLVEQAQDMAELEEALAEAVRSTAPEPADVTAILDFLEIPAAGAFDVAPEQAIGYFKAKGLKPTFSYADMLDHQHDVGFTVAKMLDVDMLGQVRASLDSALANGTAFKEWADSITPLLQSGGWWGRKQVVDPLTGQEIVAQLGSPWRLETIFRTNMQTAYAAGAWQEIKAQAELAPFLMYDAVDDFRTRPLHAAWDRKVLPVKSTWWSSHYPPNGYNCFLPQTPIAGAIVAASKASYTGEAVEIETERGARLSVTPNHPIATPNGWVAAGQLREGDHVFSDSREIELIRSARAPDVAGGAVADQQCPASAEDLFDALAAHGSRTAKVTPLDFHGDAARFDGEIDVVLIGDNRLMSDYLAARPEGSGKAPFASRDADLPAEAGTGKLPQLGVGLGATPGGDVCGAYLARPGVLTHLQPLGALRIGLAAQHYPEAGEASGDSVTAYAEFSGQLIDRGAGHVAPDKIIRVRRFPFSGHVFDVQTLSGALSAGGIVAHNCRCGVIQLSADEVEAMGLRVAREEPDDGTYPWTNPRTGDVHQVPNGLDPGFEHNAGKSWSWKTKELLQEKINTLPPSMSEAATKSLADAQAQKVIDDLTSAAADAAAQPVKASTFIDTPAPDPATMVVIGRKTKGGTPGALYQDTATGQKWLVKFNGSADAVQNEVLASKLYNLAGVEAPDLHAITIDGKPALASRIVDGVTEVPAKTLAATPSVTEGFAVDAWLANWDVAGLNIDNVVLVQGRALRIDVGGSLRYRAVGGLKGSAFGRTVGEIESLRDGTNAQARQVFGGMSAADVERSVEKVLAVPDADIRAVVMRYGPPDAAEREALAELMIARKQDLQRRFPAAAERVRARQGGPAPSLTVARVTAAEQQAVEASRVNGYGFSTDSDQVEDHQVVVSTFRRKDGSDMTRGFFKLLPVASRELQAAIAASAGEASSVSLSAARQSILDAVKSINYRASKGDTLDQKVVLRIQDMQRTVKEALALLDSAIAKAADPAAMQAQRQVIEAWSIRVSEFLDDARAGKKASMIPGQFPANSIPDSLEYTPKSAASGAPAGVQWKRVSTAYQFNTANFERSFAVENGGRATVSGTSLRYEATLPDGTTVVYFPHHDSVAWAMQGIVKIDVPGRGIDSTTRVFGSMNEIGLKSVRATEVDRQHLYLNAFARIALLRKAGALRAFEEVTDRGADGVQKKLAILNGATGLNIEASEGWRQIDGVRQAFGHGRAYQLRPDLDDAAMTDLDRTHVLFHNPNNLGTDGGKGVFEKVKVVIDGGGMFASLTDRFRRGVALSGSSVSRDLETGGGNYHFTRIRSRAHQAGSTGVYWKTAALRRMDAITYESDMFGSTAGNSVETYRRGQDVASFRAVAGTTSNETIFKAGMSVFDDLDRIVLASKAEVDEAIKWMQGKGYKTWPDGRALAEVIITKDKHRANP